MSEFTLNGKVVETGTRRFFDLRIARLPTHTVIDLPVYVSRSDLPGPTLLLTAGLHGNEINGIEIVRRLIATGLIHPKCGTVVAVPVVNIYGFLQQERYLPDGKDLNRSFPGNRNGSLASRVAHTLVNQILPVIDFGIDFHTGGASKDNYPQIRCVFNNQDSMNLAKAFAPPLILNSNLIDRSFRKAAHRRGKPIIVYEAGESLRLNEFAIEEGINGTLRLMKHYGMINESPEPNLSIILQKSSWIRARSSGLFRTTFKPGQKVLRRQRIGSITDPFGMSSVDIKAQRNGYILGLNNMPVISAGDALMHIGY
jgi:predicted deacylase